MNNKFYIITFCLLCLSLLTFAQPFRFIVGKDGSGTHTTIQSAINDCPNNVRSLIFVKNGTYEEKVTIGTKTSKSLKLISLIGESSDGVIITSHDALGNGSIDVYGATTFAIYANDFYAENITFQNAAGDKGQALALDTEEDRQTFKNCRLLGYQDTYRSKKGRRYYFKDCFIQGATDFVYGGGTVFFDDCTINCVKGGGYVSAPEDITYYEKTTSGKTLRYGFIFRNCKITADADVADNSYYLGRPWNMECGSIYLNCRLGKHIKPEGWSVWSGTNHLTACFAEYNSVDLEGLPVDVSNRVGWSLQLSQDDVDTYLGMDHVYSKINPTTPYNPVATCVAPSAPTGFIRDGNSISWGSVDGVAGYLILRNGLFLATTSETSYLDGTAQPNESYTYAVKAVGLNGNLSAAASIASSIKFAQTEKPYAFISDGEIEISIPVDVTLTSLGGALLSSKKECTSLPIGQLNAGTYILQMVDKTGVIYTQKIQIK
ncbi:pectinesterase family protein [uncultured Bacteroides sp.]|uniref:pectinesterase family protein n=1 Tax=uncultured Bacteroides sp. TaxID=162156 RepID=UPI002AAC4C48|nr:pectinesterase family protein [uncultured Bacteroides sp.]